MSNDNEEITADKVLKTAKDMMQPDELNNPTDELLATWTAAADQFVERTPWARVLLLGLAGKHNEAKELLEQESVSDTERQLLNRIWQAALCCDHRWHKACALDTVPARCIFIALI